jgi:hypothetical protein
MVYLNSAKRSRMTGLLVNQPTNGGNTKAGLIPKTGLTQWTGLFYGVTTSKCCKLANLQTDLLNWRTITTRPVGVDVKIHMR